MMCAIFMSSAWIHNEASNKQNNALSRCAQTFDRFFVQMVKKMHTFF